MVEEKRRVTTIVFVSALFGTLISALLFNSGILVMLCLLVHIPAYIWYCASYFPFAQNCIMNAIQGCLDKFRR